MELLILQGVHITHQTVAVFKKCLEFHFVFLTLSFPKTEKSKDQSDKKSPEYIYSGLFYIELTLRLRLG